MEANRNQDFCEASGSPHRRPERFVPSEGVVQETKGEPHGRRKPVASVRHSVAARAFSAPPVQSPTAFEPLLDLHEASAVLGMHWKTLEAKARGHEVPAFKVGKRWRFRLSSLNSWLEHGINSNTTDHAGVTRQERCS
jgi:excisionase family DNA binding protein